MSYSFPRNTRKFSSLQHSFPEILSAQVSQLISKIKEESTEGAESPTRGQLREKIASLSQLQLARAADTLAMIWDGVMGPTVELSSTSSTGFTKSSKRKRGGKGHIFSNWQRVKLALLKSIPTGTFIDVQFYAYNAICNDLPTDPKPLFISSIVIEEWAPAITTRELQCTAYSALTCDEEPVGIDSKAAPLVDGLTDDYECWHGEAPPKDNSALYVCGLWNFQSEISHVLLRKHQTEAATTVGGRQVVMLMSGAWKTYVVP